MKNIRNRRVLVISPTPTHPQNAGNRSRIFQFLSGLKALGFEIHFLYFDMESGGEHVTSPPDGQAMRKTWNRSYVVPNAPPSILRAMSKLIVTASETPLLNRRGNVEYSVVHLGAKMVTFSARSTVEILRLSSVVAGIVDRFIGKLAIVLWRVNPKLYRHLRRAILGDRRSLLSAGPTVGGDATDAVGDELCSKGYVPAPSYRPDALGIDEWYNEGLDQIVQRLFDKYEYGTVIVEYVFMSRALLKFPAGVFKVIDTHDIFTNRDAVFRREGVTETFFSTTQREEVRGFERADLLIAIQDNERDRIDEMTYTPTVTIGHKVNTYQIKPRVPDRNNILYIGAGNSGNIDGISHFIENVLPRVVEEVPDSRLILAGNICNHVPTAPHLTKWGEVERKEDAYDQADVVINPGRVGSGLKIKNVEALGFAKPLVSTPHCAEGMVNDDNGFIVANDDNEFGKAIIGLLTNEAFYNHCANKASRYAERYNADVDLRLRQIFYTGSGKE